MKDWGVKNVDGLRKFHFLMALHKTISLARNQLWCLMCIESYSDGDLIQLQNGSFNCWFFSYFSNKWYMCTVWLLLAPGLDVAVCLSHHNTCFVISRKQEPNSQVCWVLWEKSRMWKDLQVQTTNSVLHFLSYLKNDNWFTAENLRASSYLTLETLLKNFYLRWVRPVKVGNPFWRIRYEQNTQLKWKVVQTYMEIKNSLVFSFLWKWHICGRIPSVPLSIKL